MENNESTFRDTPVTSMKVMIVLAMSSLLIFVEVVALGLTVMRRYYYPLKGRIQWPIIFSVVTIVAMILNTIAMPFSQSSCYMHTFVKHFPLVDITYIIRAISLYISFGHTAEQIRYFNYLQTKKEEPDSSSEISTVTSNGNSSKYEWLKYLQKKSIAIPAWISLLLILWIPSVLMDMSNPNECASDLNIFELIHILVLSSIVAIFAIKTKGLYDGFGIKTELKFAAAIMLTWETMDQIISSVVEAHEVKAHDGLASDSASEHNNLWVYHTIEVVRLMILSILSVMKPLFVSFRINHQSLDSIIDVKKITLAHLLELPKGKNLFQAFLESTFCVENLIFVDEIKNFSKKCTSLRIQKTDSTMRPIGPRLSSGNVKKMYKLILSIRKKFIDDSSLMQLNLPSGLKNEILSICDEVSRNLERGSFETSQCVNVIMKARTSLETASTACFNLMNEDSFPRFVEKYKEDVKSLYRTTFGGLSSFAKSGKSEMDSMTLTQVNWSERALSIG